MVNIIVESPKKEKKKRNHRIVRKPNWKLRQQREQDTVSIDGFPLIIRRKPTTHEQYCLVCRNKIEKGDKQIKLPYGMWAKYESEGHAHAVYDKLGGGAGARYYTRYIYLHTECFGCIINRMMLKADLPQLQVKQTCETCRNRFNCWTGNMDKEWQKSLPNYIPSRPCGSKEEE